MDGIRRYAEPCDYFEVRRPALIYACTSPFQ
jgi:hypothetical protein